MKLGDKDRRLPYDYPRDKWERYCEIVTAYKDRLSAEFTRWVTGKGKVMEYEKFVASLDDGREVVLTTKYDGELNLCVVEPFNDKSHFVAFFNQLGEKRAGKMRTDVQPLCGEIERILKLKSVAQIVLVGELYALSKDGTTLPRGETASIILKPDSRENQIYYAVFDILELNYKPVEGDYWTKCLLLQDLFRDSKHIHVVFAKKGGKSVAEEMWKNKVLDEGYEGFVVHSDGTIKVKPMPDFDLAVIGIVQTDTYKERGWAKTLALAWMDEHGNYRYCCNCGNGLSAAEQRSIAAELRPTIVQKDFRLGKYYVDLVEPTMVVMVKCMEVPPPRNAPAFRWTGTVLENIGFMESSALREPRFVDSPDKIRRDKDAKNWLHCRLDQIPDWGVPDSPPPVIVPETAVEGPGTAEPGLKVPERPKPEDHVMLKEVVSDEDIVYCVRPFW